MTWDMQLRSDSSTAFIQGPDWIFSVKHFDVWIEIKAWELWWSKCHFCSWFLSKQSQNYSNDPWTTQTGSELCSALNFYCFTAHLVIRHLEQQTLLTMPDYRKCYVELSLGKGWGAVKLIVSCWHAAETVCKYLSKFTDSSQRSVCG